MQACLCLANFLTQYCLFKTFQECSRLSELFLLYFYYILKYVDLRQHPSLELGMMLIFSYAPYGLAEGLKLSGIYNLQ